MTDIKIFKCGLCKEHERYKGTRKGLRNHLKEEHRIMSEITNTKDMREKGIRKMITTKQRWWNDELFV
jgi:hypothetical protein